MFASIAIKIATPEKLDLLGLKIGLNHILQTIFVRSLFLNDASFIVY